MAPQLDLADGCLATQNVRIDVVELHETAIIAPMAVRSDEGATSEIPQPDRAFDATRDSCTVDCSGRAKRPLS